MGNDDYCYFNTFKIDWGELFDFKWKGDFDTIPDIESIIQTDVLPNTRSIALYSVFHKVYIPLNNRLSIRARLANPKCKPFIFFLHQFAY